jgi:CO/xanthine dehydrogenase FAD-binding subunit
VGADEIAAAAAQATADVEPRDAAGGGVAFKTNLAAVYTRRALTRAVDHARR